MLRQLVATLKAIDKPTELHETSDGSRILILPYGGRILGLFAQTNDKNFLWTNPALKSVESARAYFASDDWKNSGGDRTWLAPELDFFFPDYPIVNSSGYLQPRSLDPGRYELSQFDGRIRLTNRMCLRAFKSGKQVELELTKSVEAALDPLRHKRNIPCDGVEYAGYTLATSLRIMAPRPEAAPLIGLWSLTQMPHGGELFIPTYFKAVPTTYFGLGDTPSDELIAEDRLVRFKMRAKGEHKIGVPALATTGRIGYLYPAGESSVALIVRNFFVNPSGDYVDVPWTAPNDTGCSAQACSVHSKWGMFSELEYHVPAIGGRTGRGHVEDFSQLWAFRGTKRDIERIARLLLAL